jgi:hypothetical protein
MTNEKMDFRAFMDRIFFGMLFGGCAILWGEISKISDHDKLISSITTKIVDLEKRIDKLEK